MPEIDMVRDAAEVRWQLSCGGGENDRGPFSEYLAKLTLQNLRGEKDSQ